MSIGYKYQLINSSVFCSFKILIKCLVKMVRELVEFESEMLPEFQGKRHDIVAIYNCKHKGHCNKIPKK